MAKATCSFIRTLVNLTKQKPVNINSCLKYHQQSSSRSWYTPNKSKIITASVFGGTALGYCLLQTRTDLTKVFAAQLIDPRSENSGSKYFNYIADVVEKVSPAVVFIEVKGRHPYFNNIVSVSSGSGFFVQEDGIILTNAHVVANYKTVSVKLQDGRVFEGYVEFIDEYADLATVRVNSKDFPIIKLGDSTKLRAGEWVIAMGSPFALSNTITVGVASSVNRPSKELGLYKEMDYIQTDAAINIGNSGGPLINLDGEAIGINTMTATAGISFAVPSIYAVEFLKKAEKYRQKTSSWWGSKSESSSKSKRYIGVTMLTLTPNLIAQLRAREFDFPELTKGILVWKVVVGSPAHLEGLQAGDVITHINDRPAESANDIYKAIESGQPLNLTVRRKTNSLKIKVHPQVYA